MKLMEVRKKPPPFTEADMQLAKQAFGFVLRVQKRLEEEGDGWKDEDGFGGTGIYSTGITFRWFIGEDTHIDADQLKIAKSIISQELKKLPELKAVLNAPVRSDDSVMMSWKFAHASPQYHSFWAAYKSRFDNKIDYDEIKGMVDAALNKLSPR